MRRRERAIIDRTGIEAVIRRADVCRLGLSDDGQPYIVPVNFGYEDGVIFVHSAPEGRKIDIIKRNPRVCFEVDVGHELVKAEAACDWTARYESVIGFGKASIVEDDASKRRGLDVIMRHYAAEGAGSGAGAGDGAYAYKDAALRKMVIIRVDIESMTGKRSRD
jgi:nitroimidazol reductase NimA-like FMN-containing flavoprotein (pyridoxamine 5'-phosphate oxidase superfamily)